MMPKELLYLSAVLPNWLTWQCVEFSGDKGSRGTKLLFNCFRARQCQIVSDTRYRHRCERRWDPCRETLTSVMERRGGEKNFDQSRRQSGLACGTKSRLLIRKSLLLLICKKILPFKLSSIALCSIYRFRLANDGIIRSWDGFRKRLRS